MAVILVGAALALGAVLHLQRPPRKAWVTGQLPVAGGAVVLDAIRWEPDQRIGATAHAVSVNRGRSIAELGMPSGGSTLELRLETGAEACERLASRLGAVCGFGNGAPAAKSHELGIEWRGERPGAVVGMSFNELERLGLTHAPVVGDYAALGSWTLVPDAERSVLHLGCEEATQYVIVFPGEVVNGSCTPHGRQLRIGVRYPSSVETEVTLDGLGFMAVTATGQSGHLVVDEGQLQVEDSSTAPEPLDATDELAIQAENESGVALELVAVEGEREPKLTMTAASAQSVTLGGRSEQIPTLLEQHLDIWNQVLFLFLGLLLGLGFERLRRRG